MPDGFTDLLDRLDGVRLRGDQADARCPAHDDRKASLSVARGGDGKVVLTCHAGCRWTDVLAAVGMDSGDVFGEPRIVAEYTYTDRNGRPLYTVERWSPKTFKQRLANGTRRAPRDEDRVVYNLPMLDSIRNGMDPGCYFVEGERDVHTLTDMGFAATTTLGGANKPWQPQYTEQLAGLHVVVVADNDAPGRKWAHTVAGHLNGFYGTSSRVVAPPRNYKDITELVEGGGSLDQLVTLASTIGDTASAADIPTKAVEWLWPGRLPANMLTLLEGDPGTGKSTLAIELVACLTTGRALPGEVGFHRRPVTVAMLADEDNWSVTVVPRLKAAGADLHRVHHLRGIRDGDFLNPYSLADLSTLRHDIRALHAKFLLIDPLVAYFGGRDVDTHRDQHVRSILGPLVQVAEEDELTILAVRHFTKGSVGSRAIYRGGGSIGFTGQARAVLQTAEHPDQENNGDLFVMAVAKCNLAPLAPSLGYRLKTDELHDVARVRWEDIPVPLSAQELQSDGGSYRERGKPEPTGAGRDAMVWLTWFLQPGDEAYLWTDIVAAGKAAGHTEHTLRDHRDDVAVQEIGREGNRSARWRWNGHRPEGAEASHLPSTFAGQVAANGNGAREPDYRERAFKDDDGDDTEPHLPPFAQEIRSANGSHPALAPELQVLTVERVTPESTCRLCGSIAGVITFAEPVGGRCVIHNPEVYSE